MQMLRASTWDHASPLPSSGSDWATAIVVVAGEHANFQHALGMRELGQRLDEGALQGAGAALLLLVEDCLFLQPVGYLLSARLRLGNF